MYRKTYTYLVYILRGKKKKKRKSVFRNLVKEKEKNHENSCGNNILRVSKLEPIILYHSYLLFVFFFFYKRQYKYR